MMYGGVGLAPGPDAKQLQRWQLGADPAELTVNPPLERPGEWSAFRLVVNGGRSTTYWNGRKIHEEPLAPDGDPWLALVCPAAETGSARKVTISGNPQIPEKLKLSALPELSGWLDDEYDRTPTGELADWEKRGDEIVGRLRTDVPHGSKQESVLRYHRPMIENGRIAYEFYFEPGQAMVHPALDRMVFLIEPAGVGIHWLTDGAFERTGLAPENREAQPGSRPGSAPVPLEGNAWNRLVVTLADDRATLELNGRVISQRKLEPTNQRSFGLFHYADETEVRVRNVTYEGQWPRTLPAELRAGTK